MPLLTGVLAPALAAAVDSGGYVSLLKLIPVLLLLLIWARLVSWMDKDAVAAHMPREAINTLVFGAGLLGFLLFFFVPNFWIALVLALFLSASSFSVYLMMRQSKVGLGDLKTDFNNWVKNIGKKKEDKKQADEGEVQILVKGAPLPVPKAEDPELVGYQTTQEMLSDPMRRNAERLEVRSAETDAALTYTVDGVGYTGRSFGKEKAGAAITYLKKAAGLDVEDKRKPQNGTLKLSFENKKRDVEIATAGTTLGESMRLTFESRKRSGVALEQLGLSEDQLALMKEVMEERRGIVLVSAPKGQGLTTMLYSILRGHDAILNHISSVEHAPKEDLEGITQNKLPAQASGAEEIKQVEWVCSTQPEVMLVDEITQPASAKELIRYVSDPDVNRRVYLGVRAGNSFEALSAWRRLVGDDRLAAEQLRLIITGRVLRKLCLACKLEFQPDPETLRKYNMNPNKVTKLFRARTQPLVDPKGRPIPCEFCHDMRFKGRFGVYEIVNVDDAMREAIAGGASTDQLKNVFRKQRGRYLQEMALSYVEAGDTSVEEVIRVLRGPEQPAKPTGPGAAAPAVAAARQPTQR